MGLFDKLRNELIDIIEWLDDSRHTLVWRFPRYQNEIKNGAQLIVRPGQTAVFVHRGQIADVFEPGHYELKTDNLPILSTIAGWKYGFNSPFRAEVYFVSTRQITDLKWGTPNPIMLRDPNLVRSEFGHLAPTRSRRRNPRRSCANSLVLTANSMRMKLRNSCAQSSSVHWLMSLDHPTSRHSTLPASIRSLERLCGRLFRNESTTNMVLRFHSWPSSISHCRRLSKKPWILAPVWV